MKNLPAIQIQISSIQELEQHTVKTLLGFDKNHNLHLGCFPDFIVIFENRRYSNCLYDCSFRDVGSFMFKTDDPLPIARNGYSDLSKLFIHAYIPWE